jgi:hypothetical protein
MGHTCLENISPLIISLEDVSESNDEDEIMEEVKV